MSRKGGAIVRLNRVNLKVGGELFELTIRFINVFYNIITKNHLYFLKLTIRFPVAWRQIELSFPYKRKRTALAKVIVKV